jgi:carbamoyltransferase
MLTLGLAGGLDPIHEDSLDTPDNYTYDGAAVLVEDGRVVAAMEEARLNRIRRSNKFPFQSIRFCLEQYGARFEDVDRIAYYVHEEAANALLSRLYLARPEIEPRVDARAMLAATLGRGLGSNVDRARLRFVQHKLTHAVSAMYHSGFDSSLIFIIDNAGGAFLGRREGSGAVTLDSVAATPPGKSLGRLCHAILPFLGLGLFDEYKAMALAPYGDPATYAAFFESLYDLLPDGDYALRLERVGSLIGKIEPRRKDQEFAQTHKDLAAGLQRAMEGIALHALAHYRKTTGQHNLCMAGGMVENSGVNGAVLYSGLFDNVFVDPSAYDAGCAVGAALLASYEGGASAKTGQTRHVYWGAGIGDESEIARELQTWRGFLDFKKAHDVERSAAEIIAQGAIVGWAQGRSEFGSRALGNRNVFVDPRSAESRRRFNEMLKRGEDYRPLAAAVLEEDAREFFDLPSGMDSFPFAAFVVKARDGASLALPAAIHVDGTARLQTVCRETNPRLWALIRAFKEITGIPVLASASFNSGAEPTIDSVNDAIVSFLTTGIDRMVVGDFMVERRSPAWDDQASLLVSLPPYMKLFCIKGFAERRRAAARYEIRTSYDSQFRRSVSEGLYELLLALDGPKPVRELLGADAAESERNRALVAELNQLWSERLIVMRADSARRNVV